MHKEKLDFGKYSLIKAYKMTNTGIIAMLNKKEHSSSKDIAFTEILFQFGHHYAH